MKVNSDKSYLLMSGNKAIANNANNFIESEDIDELLRLTIDSKLTFETHINKLCNKASQKLKLLLEFLII